MFMDMKDVLFQLVPVYNIFRGIVGKPGWIFDEKIVTFGEDNGVVVVLKCHLRKGVVKNKVSGGDKTRCTYEPKGMRGDWTVGYDITVGRPDTMAPTTRSQSRGRQENPASVEDSEHNPTRQDARQDTRQDPQQAAGRDGNVLYPNISIQSISDTTPGEAQDTDITARYVEIKTQLYRSLDIWDYDF
ncbi:hypothetical protein ACMFMG_008271 [Clarireedia jacksonii]